MPWGDNMLNDTGDGYLFSTEEHIGKRNEKGELVWHREPQLPEAFDWQGYCRLEYVDVLIGSYFPKQKNLPNALPILLFLDQEGNLIRYRKYSAQALDITGDYIESVSVSFKKSIITKERIGVVLSSYGIGRPKKNDFMLIDATGDILERYPLSISSDQNLVGVFEDSTLQLRYVLGCLNQITIL